MPRLILREQGRERVFELDIDKITIGRSKANAVPINDAKASRAHCAIQKTEQGCFVVDLGSSNGTLLNGTRVQKSLLALGDVISIGSTEIHFERVIEEKHDTKPMNDSAYIAQVVEPEPVVGREEAKPVSEPVKPVYREKLDSLHADVGGARYLLKMLKGGAPDSTYPLGRDNFTIGRRGNNTLTIDDERISGNHVQISREGSLWVLTDLGSTNGTIVRGRKITREILEHGAVFSIGGNTFQFVDLQGAQLAKAAPAESIEISEPQGLPSNADFAHIDVQQAMKRQGSNAVLTFLYAVAVIFLIVGVVYYSFQVFGQLLGRSSITAPPDSLVSVNWSFEQRLSTEKILEGWRTPANGWSVDSTNAKTGKASLKLDCSVNNNQDDMLNVSMEPTTITSDRQYQVKVQVKTGNIRKAGVRVVWSDPLNPHFVQESYSKLLGAEGGAWKPLRWTFVPPRKATRMELSICAFGNRGVVWFDDVELYEDPLEQGTRKEQTVSLEDEIEISVDPRGTWSLFRRGALTFWDSQIFLGGKDGEAGAFSRQALSEIQKRASTSGDTMLYLGRIYNPHKAAWVPLTQEIRIREDILSVHYKLAGEFDDSGTVGVCLNTRPDMLSKSQVMEVTSDSEGVKVFSNDFEIAGAKDMVLGSGENRVAFAFPEPVDVSAKHVKQGLRITLSKPLQSGREAELAINFSEISLQQQKKAEDVFGTIAKLREAGKLQEAINLAGRFRLEGIMQEDQKKKLESLIKDIEADGDALVKEVNHIYADFKKSRHLELLKNLGTRVEQVSAAFPGSEQEKRAESLLADARMALNKAKKQRLDSKANDMLLKGDSYRESGLLGLAAVHYEYVRDNFKGTEWEKDAIARLDRLEVQIKAEGRW